MPGDSSARSLARGPATSPRRSGTTARRPPWPRSSQRPLVAHCHFGLGKLYGGVGQPHEARERLAAAATMYREMDMRFWLKQATTLVDD